MQISDLVTPSTIPIDSVNFGEHFGLLFSYFLYNDNISEENTHFWSVLEKFRDFLDSFLSHRKWAHMKKMNIILLFALFGFFSSDINIVCEFITSRQMF